jgi:hypothetical protein
VLKAHGEGVIEFSKPRAFNLPHVHLVDTAPRGVCEINERGVRP